MPSNENTPAPPSGTRGANSQRKQGKKAGVQADKTSGRPRRANGDASAANDDAQAEITRLRAQLAEVEAANKTLEQRAARGATATEPEEDIVALEKPKGEAGDRKKGFVLIEAMGLEDDPARFLKIQASASNLVHENVIRANLDVRQIYRKQDPAKLAAVFKLVRIPHVAIRISLTIPSKTRKGDEYLTEKRFPLNWATAEMVKQFLRNRRRYKVRMGEIPNRETRKRQAQDNTAGARKRRKTASGNMRHIDDDLGSENDDQSQVGSGDDNASGNGSE
ncbi:hypothetical protein B0H13DRAFT_2578096 [Mycena leptocephala]|nr:hypothetical protein B0H13DRAFT_2578096 [Mycena leptocephala]